MRPSALRMVGSVSGNNHWRLAEQKTIRLRELSPALSQTSQTTARLADLTLVFQEICRMFIKHGHFHLAGIGLVDSADRRVCPAAIFVKRQEGVQAVLVSTEKTLPEGHGGIGTAIWKNRCGVCHDIFANPDRKPSHAAARLDGFHSFAGFPVRRHGAASDSLNLYSTENDLFDQAVIELLENMARDISFAIDNYEREQAKKINPPLARSKNLKPLF